MRKILINNRFYLIALSAVMVCAVTFFVDEKFQSENELNYQVDFIAEPTRVYTNKFVSDDNAANKKNEYGNELESFNELESNKKLENEKNIKIEKIILKDDSNLQIQNLQSYVSGFSSDLLMAVDLQEKFDADAMDYALVNEAEKDLAYVFYQGMEWQEFSPQDISCKATMCRVKLTISDEQENNKLMELISNEMKLNNINYAFALPVNLPAEGIDYIYFVKSSLSGVLPGNK